MQALRGLLLTASVLLCTTAQPYSGAQLVKVNLPDVRHLDSLLSDPRLDVWSVNGTQVDVLVPSENWEAFKEMLSSGKISYEVSIVDIGKAIEEENTPSLSSARSFRRLRYRMNWNNYQRLGTIYDYLDYLARTYPSFVTVGAIGFTPERRQLKYIKIFSGKPNAKIVVIDGGIHAREWTAPAAVTYVIRELVENRSSLASELREVDFYILPVMNPDGYEFSHTTDRMWRKNRRQEWNRCMGVDLNRNFDFYFAGKGTSGDPCSDIYRGRSAASESETRAFMGFIDSISPNLKAYITFHSYGQYILVPYGFDNRQYPANFNEMKAVGIQAADAIRRATGAQYSVGNTADTLYPAAGGSDDWVKGTYPAVTYVYCIELRDTGSRGFLLPANKIQDAGRDAFAAVTVIASAASKA